MNLGACYCHIASHPGQVALLLSLGKASLLPHTEEAKAKGLTFFFHPSFPCHMYKKEPSPGQPIFICANDWNCCLFLKYAPSHPFKDWDCWFLQKIMHVPFGNYHLLKKVNMLMEMEDGSGWAEIRQRWECCRSAGGTVSLSHSSPMGSDLCSFRRESGGTWHGRWNFKVELSIQVKTGDLQ